MLSKKCSLILLLPLILIFIHLVFIPVYANQSVKFWEESLVIPTYRAGKPDVNPIFYSGRAYQGAKGAIYPYPLLDKLTNIREEIAYRAVYLENDYVKICVLPEIGGRIFSALDKTNNYDFFYRQHVIKPALIGMLGAWISGGVEWNFPHHHRATGFMPVDYTLVENPDGSKTVWVGEIEIRHRMKWVIGLTLYPDSSCLEATIRVLNRTPFAHSFLCWANVAVHTNSDYQIIFPPSTEYATFHGKNQFSRWPFSSEVFNGVDYTKGVDVSWWKNHPRPTSFFAWDCKEDFLAGYDHGKDAGLVHVADHRMVPGKKFWTWGTGEGGQMWEKILTETDGPYIELMVGAYSDNQPDYSWIHPYEVRTFRQYWYPIKQIRGVKSANRQAALNMETTPKRMVLLGFYTTEKHSNARALLKEGERLIYEQGINISPQKPFLKEIELPQGANEEDLKALLVSDSNEILVSYQPVKKEKTQMPESVKAPPSPEKIKSNEELYLTGLRLEQFNNPAFEPYPYYEEALKRDPGDSRVNTALGILYLKRGMFKEAEGALNRAVSRITRDYTTPKNGEAFYYLGVVLRAVGKMDKASDAFYKAAWSQDWGAASYYSLAELESLKGDLSHALEFLDRSLSLNALSPRFLNFKAALMRRLGRLKESETIAQKVLRFDPLDFWAGNEQFLAKLALGLDKEAQAAKRSLNTKMRNSPQSYLELAVDYGNCGLADEAVDVLSRLVNAGVKGSSTHPMLYYYMGHYLEQKGEKKKAQENYRLASQMPADYCFPFRLESIDVLRTAQKINPSDARASYYLGNLLYDHQPEAAIKEWERSRGLDESFPIVHRNLGLAYARMKNDIPAAIMSMEKAVSCNRKDARYFYELDLLYEAGRVSPEKRLSFLERNHEAVLNRDDSLSREIMLLVQMGKYDRAIELLSTHHFHVWEGGGRIHNVYVDAHVLKGHAQFSAEQYGDALGSFQEALGYPENLEVGRPYGGGREAQLYYFIGTVYEAMKDREKARKYYEESVAMKHGWSEISYYQGLGFQKLGQRKKAEQMFNGLIKFAEARLDAVSSMDFFTKFGERQSAMYRKADAHYLKGLGYLGNGRVSEARAQFAQALECNGNHLWAKQQLIRLDRKDGRDG